MLDMGILGKLIFPIITRCNGTDTRSLRIKEFNSLEARNSFIKYNKRIRNTKKLLQRKNKFGRKIKGGV